MIDFLYKLDYDDHYLTPYECQITSIPKDKSNIGANTSEGSHRASSYFWKDATSCQDTDPDEPGWTSPLSLIINAKIYVIADKYGIEALKDLAATKYRHALSDTWNSSGFIESAYIVYDDTVEADRMLRDAIVQRASENVKVLLDRSEFVDLLMSHADLAVEILEKVANNLSCLPRKNKP